MTAGQASTGIFPARFPELLTYSFQTCSQTTATAEKSNASPLHVSRYLNQFLSSNTMNRKWIYACTIVGCLFMASCGRPIYSKHEEALGQAGVDRFHELFNKRDYEAIYLLMPDELRRLQPIDIVRPVIKATADKWGKQVSTIMAFAKVFPTAGTGGIELRMVYNTTFENGKAQEWFTWSTDGKQARLIGYKSFNGWADPAVLNAAASK